MMNDMVLEVLSRLKARGSAVNMGRVAKPGADSTLEGNGLGKGGPAVGHGDVLTACRIVAELLVNILPRGAALGLVDARFP